jgi:hypothetical protein
MNDAMVLTLASHFALAVVLFFGVNWIGKHAVEFGYTSMTLFEEPNESVALNFFLRAMSPAVFIIAVSATVVAIGHSEWRIGIQWVAIYYYVVRAFAIFLLNRQRLVSWPKFVLHAGVGISFAIIAYRYLIIPNHSLLPNMEQAGNELWLAILAFLYAVANKVPVTGGPGARRRNNFVALHYAQARTRFSHIIDAKVSDDRLRLIIYGVLIYEDYARPAAIRRLERWMFWKKNRTTGIMQVTANKSLSDAESITQGTDILAQSWAAHAGEKHLHEQAWRTIADYNADTDYIGRVLEVIEILAKRVETRFLPAYSQIWD